MKQIILIRSGSTAWEEADAGDIDQQSPEGKSCCCDTDDRRLQGTLPLPLSDKGKAALNDIAEILKREGVGAIYSSGNESSEPTAKYLAELCELKSRKVTDLTELNCGLWQGLRIKDIKKRYGRAYKQWRSDPLSVCPPEGEQMDDCQDRAAAALKCIVKKNKADTAVIVAAQIVAAQIESLLTGRVSGEFWDIADDSHIIKKFRLTGAYVDKIPQALLCELEVPDTV